ncbi:MAG: RNA polymerase subunit sigma-24 [Pseudonocardiales bacterium]|nr:MAG: RNA polymerase subunit sigma-24 [Pseudonocardiales bacterium]
MTAFALQPLAAPSLGEGFAVLRSTIELLLRAERAPVAEARSGSRSVQLVTPSVAGPAGDRPPDESPGEVWAVVERAQAGDAEAFGELYDRYVDLVFRYIHFRVGSRPQAEDLTSETFTRALRRICSVTWQGRDFGAWLVTIARNLIADHYKSSRYRLEISTADMLDADRAEDGPEDDVLDAMTSATLLEAVKKLNAEQQECIVLRFLQGLSVAETAQAMGKNDGAIKALQYRAVRTLGRLLPSGFVR